MEARLSPILEACCSLLPRELFSPVLCESAYGITLALGALGPNIFGGGAMTMPEASPLPLKSPTMLELVVIVPTASPWLCDVVRAWERCSAVWRALDAL